MIDCQACRRSNLPTRTFCGGCGVRLAVICTACTFANQGIDRFCGQCGVGLAPSAAVAAPAVHSTHAAPAPVAHAPVAHATADSTGDIDFAELFRRPTLLPVDELPNTGITQSDLDRLFGGGS